MRCHTRPDRFGLFPQCGTRIKDRDIKKMSASHAHSWHEDVSSCEPFKPSTSCFIGWKKKYCLAIWKMTSLCSNHVLLVATLTKHNNQIINRIKPISTNSTVIKGVPQKLKSEKNVKFAFIGNTAV